ncbi:hypothetical protein D3C73_1303630 [compost metagenome]
MAWPVYLVVTFGSAVTMFVVARLSYLKKMLLMTAGFFLLGCTGLTLMGAKLFNVFDMGEYANTLSFISMPLGGLALPITMIGTIIASKDKPDLHKKLIRTSIMMLVIVVVVIVVVAVLINT